MKNRNQDLVLVGVTSTNLYPPTTFSALTANWYVNAPAIIKSDFKTFNPWSYTVQDTYHFRGTRFQKYFSTGNWSSRDGGFGYSSDPPWYPNWERTDVYNRALEKLNTQVRGNLDLSVAIAEIGATRRMLAALAEMRRLANLRRIGSTSDLANGWLQWQYGWRQMMQDIFGIANELLNVALATIQKFEARVTMPIAVDLVKGPNQIDGLTNVYSRALGFGKQSCTMKLRLKVPGFDLARFGTLNPVGLAWELVPYSFVIDWFYDVGSYLRNMETALLYNVVFESGYVSELYAYDGSQRVINRSTGSPPHYVALVGNYYYTLVAKSSVRRRQFVRTKLTSYPLPRKPTFQVDLNSSRIISAGALLRQLLPR